MVITVFEISGGLMAGGQLNFCPASGNFQTASLTGLWNIFFPHIFIISPIDMQKLRMISIVPKTWHSLFKNIHTNYANEINWNRHY